MIKTLYKVVMPRFHMGEMIETFEDKQKANDFAKLNGLKAFWKVEKGTEAITTTYVEVDQVVDVVD